MSPRKRVIRQAKSNQDIRQNGSVNYGAQPRPNGSFRQPAQPNGGHSGYRSESQSRLTHRNNSNRQPQQPPMNISPPPGPPPPPLSHSPVRKNPRDPTEEELEVVRAIIQHCDKDSFAILTREQADLLPPLVHLPPSIIEEIWGIVDIHGNRFLSHDQIAQFVRLLGYAQVRESPKAELLGQPGPIARIDGWTIKEGQTFDEPATDEERVVVEAIMREADKGGFGILERDDAAKVLRRSGLPDDDLAIIWSLVDATDRGFFEKGDLKRALRLISCVQRGYPLHSRQSEKPWPPPVLDDTFDTTRAPKPKSKPPRGAPTGGLLAWSSPPEAPSSSSAVPSFPMPKINVSLMPTATGPSQGPPPSFPNPLNFSTNPPNPSMSFNPSISSLALMPTLTGIAPLNYSFTPPASSSRSIALPTRPENDPLPALTDTQREAFVTIFNRCNPIGGFITGAQGREVFKRSRLSDAILDKIWRLADSSSYYKVSAEENAHGGGGSLSRSQFVIAMYFIKAVMDGVVKGENLPDSAPPWLRVEATKDSSKPYPLGFPTTNITGDNNASTSTNASNQYLPTGAGAAHLRSQSQPALVVPPTRARPESSLIDMDGDALQPQPPAPIGRRPSASVSAGSSNFNPNLSPSSHSAPPSANRSAADLNRDLPPTPIATSPLSPLRTGSRRNTNANTEASQPPQPSQASLLDDDIPNHLPEAEAEAPPPYTEVAPNVQIT